VLPDASIWIVVSLGSDVGTRGRGQAAAPTPTSFVIGPQTAPLMMEFGPTVRLAIVAFDASICESVLRIRATEIANRVTALDRYWPGALPQLLADCAPKGPVEVVRGIHRLLPTCTGLPPAADRLCAAGSFIRQRKGNVSVYHLATTIGVTRQYLSRLFHAHLGWSAKAHIRLARFNALSTAVLEGKTTRWRDLATELGLADQAHLIREFRRFAGKPPKRFLREGFE
jgi:AraC-like DNA-binding protein